MDEEVQNWWVNRRQLRVEGADKETQAGAVESRVAVMCHEILRRRAAPEAMSKVPKWIR